MKQIYKSNLSYNLKDPVLNTQIKFLLNSKGRLIKIIWHYETIFDGARELSWGNEKQEKWDLENEGNEYDLINAFTKLALGNPDDFKALYYTLKEHDDVTFPAIQQTLKEIQETFNFN